MFISSTVNQFKTSTVSTSLISSTESIGLAKFPKIVICNKYQLRWEFGKIGLDQSIEIIRLYLRGGRTVAISKIIKRIIELFGISRKSFMNSLISLLANSTKDRGFSEQDVASALYAELISGWGYLNSTAMKQVVIFLD